LRFNLVNPNEVPPSPLATSSSKVNKSSSDIVNKIFRELDNDNNGMISVDEAARVLLRLNSRLGRNYGEDESRQFFQRLDVNKDGQLSLDEFKVAFERLV
jgi:Ca2+-binding EF-hand superfamily protein